MDKRYAVEVTYRPPGRERVTRLLERGGAVRIFPSRAVAESYCRAVNATGGHVRVVTVR